MPLIPVVLNPGSTDQANVSELHSQLSNLGMVIAPDEQTANSYGNSTVAAVQAFRQQYGLPAGDMVDASTERLMYAASAFAGYGGRTALGAAVREVAPQADTSQPQELYWLARYALVAGDYQAAYNIASLVPNHPGVIGVVDPVLMLPDPQPHPPELPYPENFYTYRHDLYPLDALQDMQRQVTAVGEPPRDSSQANGSTGEQDGGKLIRAAASWFEAIKQWQTGNVELNHREYEAAQLAYDACQDAACNYFANFYLLDLGKGTLTDRLSNLIKYLAEHKDLWHYLWSKIVWRRGLLSLEELRAWDFPENPFQLSNLYVPRSYDPPTPDGTILPPKPDYGLGFIQHYLQFGELEDPGEADRQNVLEAPLVTVAFILAPLARAEANRAQRQYEEAIHDLRWVLDSVIIGQTRKTPQDPSPPHPILARLACEFIELPFARLLLAETMLDKADAEYKAQSPAEPPPARPVRQYQDLKAAQTYFAIRDALQEEGEYVSYVDIAGTRLTRQIQQCLDANDTKSQEFQLLGKDILLPTFTSSSTTLPGLDRRKKAHEPLLRFKPIGNQKAMRETNPRVYAILLTVTARLEQLKAGLNYLGYLDSYVPPWRFQFLLERARYFAEHAKNAQRDFLNFLSNAEHEDFQELSASQNVEMEKSNLHVETARVDQASAEVNVASQSAILAQTSADNAAQRVANYTDFDHYMDEKEDEALAVSAFISAGTIIASIPTGGAAIASASASGGSNVFSIDNANSKADAERELELKNLKLAQAEAEQAAKVAQAQLTAAKAGLVVAGLQRQAALLRHEFALQNLQFLRSRTLNTEQWYRLVAAIRSVSEIYLHYSIELAFLAEQAYEFEADKRINVIRFDYDLSEVGNFLAADFLLRDLDTLEQDLIVTQHNQQQHVRYVLSMARDFPEALQEIRDIGRASFSLRLEQLEKRFPGLYNLRIGAVDVLPIALLDSTRFSLELTHLGTSQVRLKAQPDTPSGTQSPSPLNINDLPVLDGGWLADLQEAWPVKLRVTGPETAVFSGLTRQEANAVFAFATTGQRQAFEDLGAAAAWEVDFTARENQVVSGSLADILITLTLSGYHDPELRSAVDHAPRNSVASTRWVSGQTTFPDALYEFNRSGLMTWNITHDLLTLTDDLGALRNAGILMLPSYGNSNYFGRIMSNCAIRIRVTSTGDLAILSEIPQVTFTAGDSANPLLLTAQATLPAGGEISWDFGDGSPRQIGNSQQHTYAKPGKFTVTLRVVRNGHLSEFQACVVVSRSYISHLSPPITAFPTLARDTGAPAGQTRVVGTVNAPAGDPVIASWRVGEQKSQKGNSATFDLEPGDYTVFFSAVRLIKACVYSNQRYLVGPTFDFNGLSLATNRCFDLDGNETTGTGRNPPANPFTKQIFNGEVLSPVDKWTLEIPLSDNAFLRSVSATDIEQIDLGEIQDVVLALEYETTPKGT